MMSQNSQRYRVGQRVTGRVEKLLPYGLFVRLDDGTRAYIRRRELTWAGNIDPRELWQEGEQIEGVVLKLAGPGQNMELSQRASSPDPWEKFAGKFRQGDGVEGTVKSLLRDGIFVEIMPGVDGWVSLQQLATWEVQRPEEVVWLGDTVEAVITSLDHPTRKLRLSIRARLRQLEVVAGIMEHFNLSPGSHSGLNEPDEFEVKNRAMDETSPVLFGEPDIAPFVFERIGRILVVDDYEEIRLPLVKWLQHRGFEVDEAKDAEEADEKAQHKSYGVLLVDLNLPGADGLALLRQIRRRGLACHAVIMSTAEWLAERSDEIEEIGVVEALVKPLDMTELEQLLGRIGQAEVLPYWQRAPEPAPVKASDSFYQLTAAMRTGGLLADQLRAGLQALVATTSAEAGLIFQLNPVSQAGTITASVGKIKLNEAAIWALGMSPVREVIRERKQLFENQMQGKTRERFRKLLDLLPFEACIGIPVEASGETHRAVFLFHRQPGAFNRYHLRDALATGVLFAAAIEREAMEQRFRALNKLLLAGQLAGGFSHEVYNKMSGLEIQLRNLQTDCRAVDGQPACAGDIHKATGHLLLTFNDLKDTVGLFQQLMRADEEQRVGINEVIQRAVALLRPSAHKHKIRVELELCPDLPNMEGSVIQLQQVFLNLMLNATQQMALQPGGARLLSITTSYQPEDKARPIKVRFADTGPGIHRQLWQKIFDLGFTTRLGGTGQGLYIARGLVESLGGKMGVERSAIPIGTTFLIELPVILAEGKMR